MSTRVLAHRYELIEPIGRGGMGTVWRAKDTMLGRDVAIKEVRLPSDVTPERREELINRTMREGRICARLNHPSVISVHDVIQENNQPWLVMELIRGRALDRIVAEDGPLDPLQVVGIGQQLVAALRSAHAAGVLHRDVKPANVLVNDDGRAILTDFGIAVSDQEMTKLTLTGKLPGAAGYVAPERQDGDTRPESDLWSLGATLYFAVEGRVAYERSNVAAQLIAPRTEDPDPPQRAGPLWPVLEGLLRRDPALRLQGSKLDEALARAAFGHGGSGQPDTTLDLSKMTDPHQPVPRTTRPAPPPVAAVPLAATGSPTRSSGPATSPGAEDRIHWRRYVVAAILGVISLILAPLLVEYLASTWF